MTDAAARPWLRRNGGHLAAIVALLAVQVASRDVHVLPLLALVAFLAAVVRKVARTRKFTTWSLMGERDDRVETLLRAYAVPVLACSVAITALR
jgi:hypothetical protein